VDILGDEFIVHVLKGLPAEYKAQVSKLEEHFGSASFRICAISKI